MRLRRMHTPAKEQGDVHTCTEACPWTGLCVCLRQEAAASCLQCPYRAFGQLQRWVRALLGTEGIVHELLCHHRSWPTSASTRGKSHARRPLQMAQWQRRADAGPGRERKSQPTPLGLQSEMCSELLLVVKQALTYDRVQEELIANCALPLCLCLGFRHAAVVSERPCATFKSLPTCIRLWALRRPRR